MSCVFESCLDTLDKRGGKPILMQLQLGQELILTVLFPFFVFAAPVIFPCSVALNPRAIFCGAQFASTSAQRMTFILTPSKMETQITGTA